MPRRQRVSVLTMDKSLKCTGTSSKTLPDSKKIRWLGRFSKDKKVFYFLFFIFLAIMWLYNQKERK